MINNKIGKTKILIVDDIPANIIAMKTLLKSVNAEFFEATNGNDALSLAIKHNFALVLLDVQMPEMSGYEVAELMHNTEKTKYIPIIFVTANMMEEASVRKGYSVGAIDYITKPIDKEILCSKVHFFLESFQQKEELRILRA